MFCLCSWKNTVFTAYILGVGVLHIGRVEFVEWEKGDFSRQFLFVHDGQDLGGRAVTVHYHMEQPADTPHTRKHLW